jgi:hypothetical protein
MPDEPAENLGPVRGPYRRLHESRQARPPALPAARPPEQANSPVTDATPTEFGGPPTATGAGSRENNDGPPTDPGANGPELQPQPGPSSPHPLPPAEREVQIALWGATSSGKSTYLWTLPLAAEQQGWTVIPVDEASEEYKVRAETDLMKEGLLPIPTEDEVVIGWRLEKAPSIAGPWWRRRQIPGSRILLRTIERKGGDFEKLTQSVADQLVRADGIVYLFDPDRELNPKSPDNVGFFIAAMTRLQRRTAELDRMVDGRLPHHLAVCITKFDAVKVFAKAREGFWVTQASAWPFFPQVSPGDAQPFFDWLCHTKLGDAASFVRDRIVANFLPQRVEYFVTSAIGFGLHERKKFDLSDFGNLTHKGDRVRSLPRPINVLEPLVALDRSRRLSGGPR